MKLSSDPLLQTVTSSFGISQLKPKEGRNSFITRADENLYRAKSSGRTTAYHRSKLKA
jgi:PleD family two-component response regulator